jgi:hypothetical protein
MPFTLIKGSFKPQAGEPDGDSVRFLADNLALWAKLKGRDVELGTGTTTRDTAQLRFEGIDAIEKTAIQPLATNARDNMFALIGHDSATPMPRGYVLARMTDDQSGRPIAFAFAGQASRADGSQVTLRVPLLRQSVNYKQMEAGFAYPLYYDTLFRDLREGFNAALAVGKTQPNGYFPTDATMTGVVVTSRADLATIPPIWPKLWRRLDEYLRRGAPLSGFKAWLAQRNERIDVLPAMEQRGMDALVDVTGNTVRLLENPENLRVVSKAGNA